MKKQTTKSKREAPPITRVAKAAGVSLGTVSRVMNGAESVNPELRMRVLRAAREIGFVPRTPARRLGVVVGRRNPLLPVGYTHIMTALIDEFAYARGMAVEQFDVSNLERAWDCGVAAVIGVVFNDAMLDLRGLPNLPVLSINHPMAEKGIHSIYTDHQEQGMMAAQHLLDRGHTRVAFLGGLRGEWGVEQRLSGYRSAMGAYNVSFDPDWVRFSDDEPVYDIVQRWIKNGVTAILNFSEDVVAETLHVLSNVLRRRIGVDISTVTLEDVPLYQYFTPPQTVMRQPLRELARLAVDHALRLADRGSTLGPDGKPEVVDLVLHGQLIARDSVADLTGTTADSEVKIAVNDPQANSGRLQPQPQPLAAMARS